MTKSKVLHNSGKLLIGKNKVLQYSHKRGCLILKKKNDEGQFLALNTSAHHQWYNWHTMQGNVKQSNSKLLYFDEPWMIA